MANPRQAAVRLFVMIPNPASAWNADGTLWHDFATGEAGDAVDFSSVLPACQKKDACRKFIELAGGHYTPAPRLASPGRRTPKPKPVLPDFTKCHSGGLQTACQPSEQSGAKD